MADNNINNKHPFQFTPRIKARSFAKSKNTCKNTDCASHTLDYLYKDNHLEKGKYHDVEKPDLTFGHLKLTPSVNKCVSMRTAMSMFAQECCDCSLAGNGRGVFLGACLR